LAFIFLIGFGKSELKKKLRPKSIYGSKANSTLSVETMNEKRTIKMIFKAHDYQTKCIDFLLENPRAGVFADPGLGKTAIVLQLLEQLYWAKDTFRTLVIAPLRVIYSVWPDELKKWDLHYLSYSILHGSKKNELVKGNADIDLVNVEALKWFFNAKKVLNYDLLVIDESSKFKSYKAKRTKMLHKRLKEVDRRIILTGTPSPNGLMDLWSQIYILDQGKTLGKNITRFRSRFFYTVNYRAFSEWLPKNGSDIAIQRQIAPLVYRIDAETHLKLPKLIINNIKVQLPKSLFRIYKKLEKKLFIELDNQQVAIASEANDYGYCRQFANGRMYKPPETLKLAKRGQNREIIALHNLKVEALLELIGELQGKPLLVAYYYKHDYDQLTEALGTDTLVLGSRTKTELTTQIIAKWNKGEIPVLLAHPQSMAFGLNLQHGGRDICWFGLTDSLEDYIQFIRRVHRQGAKGQTRVHHLITQGTVDEAIILRLQAKENDQKSMLQALAEYRRTL
jgi:SNF2 family DNA or RNA helicase